MPEPLSDILQRQLAAALDGSSQALGALLEGLRGPLEELAGRQLGSTLAPKAGASDLVQESLLAAAVGFPGFRGKSVGEFRIWIAQILEHRAIDLARRFRAGRRDVSRELKDGQAALSAQDDPAPRPDEAAARAEALTRLVETFSTLTPVERQLIDWRYRDDLSFDEIARRLNWPRETTRRRWYTVLEQIGRRLEQPE